MNINSIHRIPAKRFRRTGIQRHIGSSDRSQYPRRVRRRLVQRYVSVHGADA